MIKRIITFVLCVALCASCIAIGVINQKANEAGAVAGAIIGAGTGTVDKISADVPEGATQVEATELYEKDGVYYLGSDIDLTAGANATYEKLVALIDNKANGATAVTIDGLGNTITTNKGLFKSIANVTIKNLTIAGEVTVNDGDLSDTSNSRQQFGVISNIVGLPAAFDNVTIDANVTFDVSAAKDVSYGSFFGTLNENTSADKPFSITNSTNNGDVVYTKTAAGNLTAGGFIGSGNVGTAGMTYKNCVNNGDITAKSAGAVWIGGFVGNAYANYFPATTILNTGNITVEKIDNTQNLWVGGIAGYGAPLGKTSDCINLGNIDVTYSGSGSMHINNFCIGGIQGSTVFATCSFTRCINAGDITLTMNPFVRHYIGGIGTGCTRGVNNFIDCIDIGTHTAVMADTLAKNHDNICSITPHHDANMLLTNCYAVAFDGHKGNGGPVNGAVGSGTNKFFVTLSENIDTVLANIKAEGITNGAAVFSAILACADYDANYEHDKDDGMFLTSVAGLTVTADAERNNYFTTAIDKDYLDALKAIAGSSVEIGAIIAPATYVSKIGEFSHEAFDAYYTAHKDAIDAKVAAQGNPAISKLYMTAAFGDGADFTDVDGVYNAGIYLKGAYDTAYAAKMYVKIGDAYVYSK